MTYNELMELLEYDKEQITNYFIWFLCESGNSSRK